MCTGWHSLLMMITKEASGGTLCSSSTRGWPTDGPSAPIRLAIQRVQRLDGAVLWVFGADCIPLS